MSRNLIPRQLGPEIIEPVSSDLIEVTDGSQINLDGILRRPDCLQYERPGSARIHFEASDGSCLSG
jgi:hypothetical protein